MGGCGWSATPDNPLYYFALFRKKHLRRELKEAYKKSIFSLEYETRKSSKDFLENIDEYEGRKIKTSIISQRHMKQCSTGLKS